MFFKRLTGVKSGGRKVLLGLDNLFNLIFIGVVLASSHALGYFIFAWLCMGLLTVRIGEIIFEMKYDLFDRPFLHILILIGIPAQVLYSNYH